MRHIIQGAVILASAALFGCGNGGNNGNNGTPDAGPHACAEGHPTVTAEQLFTDVIQPECVSCHNAAAAPATNGGLALDDVAALKAAIGKASAYSSTGELKVVDANNPANSTMHLKVQGGTTLGKHRGPRNESVGGPMPQGGELTAEKKEQVKNWICSEGG